MPSVFLSHTSADKPFARRLATDLQLAGAHVWLDEAEMRLGDSLVDKIGTALASVEYVALVLSPEAVASKWVKQELEIAIAREFTTNNVIVLPLLYRQCEIPPFLSGRLYADVRGEAKYLSGLNAIKKRLGLPLSTTHVTELDGYAAHVRHQLRTVLLVASKALRAAEMAIQFDERDKAAAHVRRASGFVERGRIVNTQVALLRAFRAGEYSVLRTNEIRLSTWLRDLVTIFEKSAKDPHFVMSAANQCVVAIDGGLLEIAIYNLLDNAAKYSYNNTTTYIDVSEEQGAAIIRIKSTGLPISEEDQHRIFEDGYQSPAALAYVAGGSGTGLYLARTIASGHGGTLTYERGATPEESIFELRLPPVTAA